MPTHPKISVVIPIYNVAEYLHRCIDSVLAQSIDGVETCESRKLRKKIFKDMQ